MKNIVLSVCILLITLFFFAIGVNAQSDSSLPAVTVINLIRGNGLGHETDDIYASLKAQWQVTKEAEIPATWLLQYGALENKNITDFAKSDMKGQEFGLMFEIDKNAAEKAHVQFRGQGAWYFSDGLFLNSYDQNERIKLIDTSFTKFKDIFGYYPKTVGAWWIGGDSLTYMQNKYGITAALRAADQFNLDAYSLWGTPWNIPYLPSRNNEGIPAKTYDESSKVVILQWAIRDPVRGYGDATYSVQDYSMKGFTGDYVNYLASLYLQEPFGNIVIGLENGASLEQFQQSYQAMLTKAKELEQSTSARILLAKDFSREFLNKKKVFAGNTHFLARDYKSDDQSFWYVSPNYRATIQKANGTISLTDIRNYKDKTDEDFHILPNTAAMLRINEPAIIDSMRFPGDRIILKTGPAVLTTKEQGENVELYTESNRIARFTPELFTIYFENGKEKVFSFNTKSMQFYPLSILSILIILYFIILYSHSRNIRKLLKQFVPILIPYLLAASFFRGSATYLFDSKELPLLKYLFSLPFLPVLTDIYICKILPLLFLLTAHFTCIVNGSGKLKKRIYWTIFVAVTFLYLHFPYFPLDQTTYKVVAVGFALITIPAIVVIILRLFINKSRLDFFVSVTVLAAILALLGYATIFSRSKLALTKFEIDALEVIKDQKKNVLFVEQANYSIRPIYRSVKSMLYADYRIGQTITGKKWELVTRPESYVLKLSSHEDELLVVPRYLGSDLSQYESDALKVKKIFDNAQIAIFEKTQ